MALQLYQTFLRSYVHHPHPRSLTHTPCVRTQRLIRSSGLPEKEQNDQDEDVSASQAFELTARMSATKDALLSSYRIYTPG